MINGMSRFFQIILFFGSFLFSSQLQAAYKYNISACTIFRDEAPYLKEWIEFHRLLGIEHFYLYNNLSQDNYLEVLQPYIDARIVELIEWNYNASNLQEWDGIQIGAYNDGLSRAKKRTKWLAILDSDEFLFPVVEDDLSVFLKKYEKIKGFGGLLINWVMFGTSNIERIPNDKLLIETLLYSDGNGNEHFKSIFLTKRVARVCSPHYVVYKKGYYHLTPNQERMTPFLEIDKIRINHYWSRDKYYLNHFKIPRRLLWGVDSATCLLWSETANHHYDEAIVRFIEPLRKRMFSD